MADKFYKPIDLPVVGSPGSPPTGFVRIYGGPGGRVVGQSESGEQTTLSETRFFSVAVLTASAGSWEVPTGVFKIFVECWGAGGSGIGGSVTGGGAGGGSGGYSAAYFQVQPGDSFSYAVAQSAPSKTWFSSAAALFADAGANAANERAGGDGGAAGGSLAMVTITGRPGENGPPGLSGLVTLLPPGANGGNAPRGGAGGRGGESAASAISGKGGKSPGGGGGGGNAAVLGSSGGAGAPGAIHIHY